MKYLDRECTQCDRLLLKARALLTRCEYARWQVERLQECDKQILALDIAKADYDHLKAKYAQARDLHRALRLKLRRQYYGHLRVVGEAPNDATGIEGKAEEYLRTSADHDGKQDMQHTLAQVHEAQVKVAQQATDYCDAHNALHRVIEESRDQAIALESLAIEILSKELQPKRRMYHDFFEVEPAEVDPSQLTPLARSLRLILAEKSKAR